LLEKNA